MRNWLIVLTAVAAFVVLRGWGMDLPLLLRSGVAVALLLLGLAVWKRPGVARGATARGEEMRAARKARWLDYGVLVLCMLVLEGVLLLVNAVLPEPLENFALEVKESWVGAGDDVPSGGRSRPRSGPEFDGHVSGNWLFKPNLERRLPQRSNHKPGNKPEMFIECASRADAVALHKSRMHLRSFAFGRFNGSDWSIVKPRREKLSAPVEFRERRSILQFSYTVYQPYNPVGQNVFSSLTGCVETQIGPLTKLGDALYLLPQPEDAVGGYTYQATSEPLRFEDVDEQRLEPQRDGVDTAFLHIPERLTERLALMQETITSSAETAAQLLAIKNFLRSEYNYSLVTENESSVDPLDNFLFHEKRGYCEHFAMAAALLCRSYGIPSRVAYGWSGGRLFAAQNMFVFRAKDAHAWTEVWLQGHGWVVFDTTPPDGLPESHAAADEEEAPDLDELFGEDEVDDEAAESEDADWRLPVTILVILIGSACVLLIVRRWKWAGGAESGGGKKGVALPYFVRFKIATASHGLPMARGVTLRQHLAQMHEEGKAPEFADDLLEYHYGCVYGDLKRDKQREQKLIQAIKEWKMEEGAGGCRKEGDQPNSA